MPEQIDNHTKIFDVDKTQEATNNAEDMDWPPAKTGGMDQVDCLMLNYSPDTGRPDGITPDELELQTQPFPTGKPYTYPDVHETEAACGNCRFYVDGGACALVKDAIDPIKGICKFYEAGAPLPFNTQVFPIYEQVEAEYQVRSYEPYLQETKKKSIDNIIDREHDLLADGVPENEVHDILRKEFDDIAIIETWDESKHPRAPDGRFGDKAGESTEKEYPTLVSLNDGTKIYVNKTTGKEEHLYKDIEAKKEQKRVDTLITSNIPLSFFEGEIQLDIKNLPSNYDEQMHTQFIEEVFADLPEKMGKYVKNIELTGNMGISSSPLAVGSHNPTTKRIKIVPMNDETEFKSTLIHEIGHSYFNEMSETNREKWREVSEIPFTAYTNQFQQQVVDKFSANPKMEIKQKAKKAFKDHFYDEQFAEFSRIVYSNKGRGEKGSALEVLVPVEKVSQIKGVYDSI